MKRNIWSGPSIQCRIFFLVLCMGVGSSVGGCECNGQKEEECLLSENGRKLVVKIINKLCILKARRVLDTSDTLHTLPTPPPKAPQGSTEIDLVLGFYFGLSQEEVQELFNNTTFPCGDSENGYTLCASAKKVEPGDFLVMMMQTAGKVPRKDPTYHYQYAFVFDASDAPNYQASPKFPNDFFQGTDLWYVANYTPQKGWHIEVSQMQTGSPTPAKNLDSQARLVIKDDVLMLVVPAKEFQNKKPSYRMTAFKHKGDYGIDPPYDWNGHLVPPVAKGLTSFTQ